MILLSNHLLTLPEFKNVKDVVVRINMAHVKDVSESSRFVNVDYDIFLDYPKGRSKPPKSDKIKTKTKKVKKGKCKDGVCY